MRTLGIDLATKAANTGLCLLEWRKDEVCILNLSLGWEEAALLREIMGSDKAGVDAPLGWPVSFVSAIKAHQGEAPFWPLDQGGEEQRRDLALRLTDKKVQEATGKRPLSASTDLISLVAFRLARIEQALRYKNCFFSRDGSGQVCEVYPAAALLCWDISPKGYKGKDGKQERQRIIKTIKTSLPQLQISKENEAAMIGSDDLLDALVASLSARAVSIGKSTAPEKEEKEQANKEGWIHLPEGSLQDLL